MFEGSLRNKSDTLKLRPITLDDLAEIVLHVILLSALSWAVVWIVDGPLTFRKMTFWMSAVICGTCFGALVFGKQPWKDKR